MAEAASGEPTTGPARRCAVSREVKPKDELIRFVLSPTGEIVPDLKQNLPGRGVWVSANRECVGEAVKRNAFARSLKAPVCAAPDLADCVGRMLHEAALKAFSLANKAGAVTFGFTKVVAALAKGRVLALVHARDAAEDGQRKLDGKYRGSAGEAAVPPVTTFSIEELSLASGRPNVVHAALAQGGAAANFIAAADRAERYGRDETPDRAPEKGRREA